MNREAKGCLEISRNPGLWGSMPPLVTMVSQFPLTTPAKESPSGPGPSGLEEKSKFVETNKMAHVCSPGLLQPGSAARAMGEKAKRAAKATA